MLYHHHLKFRKLAPPGPNDDMENTIYFLYYNSENEGKHVKKLSLFRNTYISKSVDSTKKKKANSQEGDLRLSFTVNIIYSCYYH